MMNIRCMLAGSTKVGKTCLLNKEKLHEGDPRLLAHTERRTHIEKSPVAGNVHLELYTCPGSPQLATWNYPFDDDLHVTDVILLCFSVVSPSSFEEIKTQWRKFIRDHWPGKPLLLVGTKIDLRNDASMIKKLEEGFNERPISREQGEKLARELRAVKYLECSAQTQEGLGNVFQEVVLAALVSKRRELCCCSSCALM